MAEEKRKHPRFEINQLVELEFARETFVHAEGINLSAEGVLCITDEKCEPHTTVFLMMTVSLKSGDRIIKCEGVVVHSGKKGKEWKTGIRITSMHSGCEKIFKEFLQEQG